MIALKPFLGARVCSAMAQPMTYSIFDQPKGHLDVVVRLGSRSLYVQRGFLTLAATEHDLTLLQNLMSACGAPFCGVTETP